MPEEITLTSFDEGKREEVEILGGELQKVDLGQLADWIDEYKKKFGPFARLGRAGVFLTRTEEDAQMMQEDGDPEEKEIQLAKAAQAEIIRRNKVIAEKTGLSLDFSSGEEEAEWALEMRLDIGDGKKFLAYLHSLRKITESQAKGLTKVSEILASQLTHGYNLADSEDERLLELAASLKSVTSEYRRIARINPSLEASAMLLEDVYGAMKEGYLREYILAKDEKLLLPIGKEGFGPSAWHTDSSEEMYIKRWNEALEALSTINQNPKAKGLYEKVRRNLLACLEYTKRDMAQQKSSLLNNKIKGFVEATKKQLQP